MVYQWKAGSRVKLDANVAGKRLEALRKKWGGLTPRIVVEDAKSPESVFHSVFEWDVSKAAEAYWLNQASYIIRSVEIVVSEEGQEDRTLRAFVSVVEDDDTAYTSIVRAMKDTDMRTQVLTNAKNEFEALRRKYRDLVEFAKVYAELDLVQV